MQVLAKQLLKGDLLLGGPPRRVVWVYGERLGRIQIDVENPAGVTSVSYPGDRIFEVARPINVPGLSGVVPTYVERPVPDEV